MMHKYFISYILIIVCGLFFTECTPIGVRCAGKTPKYKHKKYRVKKPKKNRRTASYGGKSSQSTSSSTSEPEIKKEPIRENEISIEKTEPKNEPVSTIEQDVPDLKIGGPPIQKKTIEFRGQDIVISEENSFEFEENIEFIDQSDLFADRSTALKSVEDLSELLQNDASISVTIVGNTATTTPKENYLYGDSAEVLRQMAVLNADTVQIRDVMVARAKRVYKLLIDDGVSPDQIEYTTGSHRQRAHQRVVSFILQRKRQKKSP